MGRGLRVWVLTFSLSCVLALPARAQEPAAPGAAAATLRVFFDCQTFGCDFDFVRTEIAWVNWVNDREVADVHVLVTSEGTGGGGRLLTLDLIGRRGFEGDDARLSVATAGDATGDEVRRALVERLKLGLVRYVPATPAAERLRIVYDAPAQQPGGPTGRGAPPGSGEAVDDPWDFWVFRTSLNGSLNGESSISSTRMSGSINAQRTTGTWKTSLSLNGSRRETEYDLTDRVVESVVKDWNSTGLLARSLTGHWTAGLRTRAGSSSFFNQDLALRVAPGIEYDIFPYDESTRRKLTLLYTVALNHFNYHRLTIYGKDEETVADQSLTASLDMVQPWGQVNLFGETSHYFHDTSFWRASLGGGMDFRLFRGFSLRVNGSYSWIHDQLHIRATDPTDDEILTRQRQLATRFSYFTSFGISYRFGSIFNNVVNPRFEGGFGGMMIFF